MRPTSPPSDGGIRGFSSGGPYLAGRSAREWGERSYNIQRWNQMPRIGYFAAL